MIQKNLFLLSIDSIFSDLEEETYHDIKIEHAEKRMEDSGELLFIALILMVIVLGARKLLNKK